MPFTSELALATLRALGEWQGTRIDDFRDEDPGRIMHEMRYGEMTAFEERPHSPYYGGADTTPLYVVLLDEYERWTGDTKLVRDLEVEARAALDWIDEYADLQGNGYIWYQRRNEQTGLENQCWKDSPDSISYRDGRLPGFPRATAEQQGYAYDAKVRGARLARAIWRDAAFADRLEREAADLKRRFNRDYWVEDGEYFALALDTEGKQVDALASNNGHLLWSGIVDKSKAKAVARHLVGTAALLGLGRAHAGRGRGALQPDRLPRRHRLAVRQLVHRVGSAALRLQGGGRADRRRQPRRRRVLRRAPARGIRRLRAQRRRISGANTRRRVARRRGRRARRCSSCARCSVSSRSATTSSSTRRSRPASGRSSCSTSAAAGAASTRSGAHASRRRRRNPRGFVEPASHEPSEFHAMFPEAATRGWDEDERRQLARMSASESGSVELKGSSDR